MTRSTTSSPCAAGFTLLEAIVAVAVIGLALLPIMSFLSQAALQLTLAGEANARNLAKQDALAFLETLNPLLQETGTAEVGDLVVNWTAAPSIPANARIRPGTGLPSFSIGFYDVAVTVGRQRDRAPWFDFTVRKVGYRRLSEFEPFGAAPR